MDYGCHALRTNYRSVVDSRGSVTLVAWLSLCWVIHIIASIGEKKINYKVAQGVASRVGERSWPRVEDQIAMGLRRDQGWVLQQDEVLWGVQLGEP